MIRQMQAAALVSMLPLVVQAAPVFPSSSGVGLEPPAGMSPATEFLGFQNGASSILVLELPPQTYATLDRGKVAAQVEGAQTADFPLGQTAAFIVRGTQTRAGRSYRKWIVIVGDTRETAMVTAQVPTASGEVTDDAIEAALKTIAVRDRPNLAAQVAGLPFTVGDFAGFRPVATLLGANLVLTDGPKDADPGITQPHIVVSTGLGARVPKTVDPLTLAKAVLTESRTIKNAKVTSEKAFEANDARWAEIAATATEGKADRPVDVSLFVRFDDAGFLEMIGSTPQGGPSYAERFRKLALSVKPKA